MIPPNHGDRRRLESIARGAEAAGFDHLACGEHVFFHGACVNAFVLLAGAAAVTERIRLLSAVTLLPLYPPPLAAKLAATLACLSDGRLDLGVGVGGEIAAEFEACGVDPRRRGAIMDESVAAVRRLLDGAPLAGSDQGLRLDPAPDRHVPLWMGGRKRAAIRRAARYADVWMPHFYTPERLAHSLAEVREQAVLAGRDPGRLSGAIVVWGTVGRDPRWARRTAVAALSTTYNQDFGQLAEKYCATGTPQEVIDRLARYGRAGAESVVFAPTCSGNELPGVIDLLATEVLPALRPVRPDTAEREKL